MARKVEVRMDHTRDDIIYLAGYIDGDGCFYCGRVKHGRYGSGQQFHAKLIITSCERVSVDWFRNTFGGKSESQTRPAKNRPHDRVIFHWRANGELLDYLLPRIEPFLKVKKRQCQLMIELRKTFQNIGSKRLPQEIVDYRLALIKEMRGLNSRFHDHPLKH